MCLAIPGKLTEIDDAAGEFRTGRVNFGGITKMVSLAYTPEAAVGDYVLVHVGFALNIVDEDEAQRTLELLRELGQLDELEAPDEPEHAAPPLNGPPGQSP